jgi:hypothetical protein
MALRRLGDGILDQQDRDVIPNRISPATLATLQGLSLVLENEGFLADGADQDVEQVLGDHESGFYAFTARSSAFISALLSALRLLLRVDS